MNELQTVLVTGACGFIGAHVCRALVERGDNVRGADCSDGDLPDGVAFVRGDLADSQLAKRACKGVQAVIHLAAMADMRRSFNDPRQCHRDTATTTINLLEGAKQVGARRFILAGTGAVYGDSPRQPSSESCPTRALSPYAGAKLASESYVEAFANMGVDGVSLRYFNVYGGGPNRDSSAGVIGAFATALQSHAPMPLFGSGEQTRDFIHVSDVVAATLAALDHAPPLDGARINVGTGKATAIRRVGETMARMTGIDAYFEERPAHKGDVARSCADIARAREVLGFEPRTKLEDGLREVLQTHD